MPYRKGVTDSPIQRLIEPLQIHSIHPVGGLVATDGVQHSAVVTVGTTAIEVFTALIDPGVDLKLKEVYVGLTQKFDNQQAASVGSLTYHWRARQNNQATQGSWHAIMATQSKLVATSGATGDPVTDTFSGYIPVATLSEAPFDLSLMAVSSMDNSLLAQVKNSCRVDLVGVVIPGT